MKYDEEYNSYKFSKEELDSLIKSLNFFTKNNLIPNQTKNFLKNLSESLENSKRLCV
jgi:hypothetical protein